MARIRTIKPEFFRHEGLQDLGAEPMLVFAGLWTQCDSQGRFIWAPRQLKLDILPFMPFDMAQVLVKLEAAGFVKRYTANGKTYGVVPTFKDHQRLSGKEATEGVKYPDPICEQQGSDGEATGKQQGSDGERQESQEREREREREVSIGDKPPENIPPPPEEEKPRKKFIPPTHEEVEAYCQERKNTVHAEKFISHYTSNGWRVGKNRMVDWKAAVRTWENNGNGNGRDHPLAGKVSPTTMRNMEVLNNWEPPS